MTQASYLTELRKVVGSRLIMIPAAVALIHDARGRLLVVRLGGHADERWGLPGGRIELDETPEQAVIRETREEIGVDIRVDALQGVYGGPEFRVTYPNGDQGAYVMAAYRCSIASGAPRVDNDEVTDVRYITHDEVANLPTAPWAQIVMPAAFDHAFPADDT